MVPAKMLAVVAAVMAVPAAFAATGKNPGTPNIRTQDGWVHKSHDSTPHPTLLLQKAGSVTTKQTDWPPGRAKLCFCLWSRAGLHRVGCLVAGVRRLPGARMAPPVCRAHPRPRHGSYPYEYEYVTSRSSHANICVCGLLRSRVRAAKCSSTRVRYAPRSTNTAASAEAP